MALTGKRNIGGGGLAVAAALCLGMGAGTAHASRFCSSTAVTQFIACGSEIADDFFESAAVCINESDLGDRVACFRDAFDERLEGRELCGDQLEARNDLCELLGEDRYDPDFDPASFDDDFSALTSPNPFFPLGIGNVWVYEGGDEVITVEVKNETKRIEGVTCIVVNDVVEEDGVVIEDTDDWYGQRKNGTVDYCGELALNSELFEGDDPAVPELVDIEGSFKAGRDGARPGTIFPGDPVVGQAYRQEWAPGDAEDAAIVLSTSYGFGSDPELDELVPEELAGLLCADDDCVVTGELNPLEPDTLERKYFARDLGLFLEVNPEDGEVVELVDCNFDARCAALSAP